MSTPKKRLLVLTSTFPRWEGDHEPPFVYELSRRLVSEFEVHVLAPHCQKLPANESFGDLLIHRFRYAPAHWENLAYEGGMLARLRQNPLRYCLLPLFLLAQYIAAIRIIRRHRIDVIHAHWLIPQGLIAALIKITIPKSPPVLCTSHGGDLFSLRGRVLTYIKKHIIRHCDYLTVVSQAMKHKLQEIKVPNDKIDVIPMGVDLGSSFIPGEHQRKPNALLFTGRLVEKKGLSHLLNALAIVKKTHPEVHLDIYGDGPYRSSLVEQAQTLGLQSAVFFKGAVPNAQLVTAYQQSCIGVFPFITAQSGDQEGFGLVLVEALGCGLAVITSDMPAVRDIVTNGETALLAPQGDYQMLSKQIIRLLDNEELRIQLGTNGQAYVTNKFDWDTISGRYQHLISNLISG